MPVDPLTLIRELDHRTSDGIDVRLLWSELGGRVVVAVHDTRTDDVFSVPVLAHDLVLDVFDDPFAYASARGMLTNDLELELMMHAPLAG
jgi:hypothetical protein